MCRPDASSSATPQLQTRNRRTHASARWVGNLPFFPRNPLRELPSSPTSLTSAYRIPGPGNRLATDRTAVSPRLLLNWQTWTNTILPTEAIPEKDLPKKTCQRMQSPQRESSQQRIRTRDNSPGKNCRRESSVFATPVENASSRNPIVDSGDRPRMVGIGRAKDQPTRQFAPTRWVPTPSTREFADQSSKLSLHSIAAGTAVNSPFRRFSPRITGGCNPLGPVSRSNTFSRVCVPSFFG